MDKYNKGKEVCTYVLTIVHYIKAKRQKDFERKHSLSRWRHVFNSSRNYSLR